MESLKYICKFGVFFWCKITVQDEIYVLFVN